MYCGYILSLLVCHYVIHSRLLRRGERGDELQRRIIGSGWGFTCLVKVVGDIKPTGRSRTLGVNMDVGNTTGVVQMVGMGRER